MNETYHIKLVIADRGDNAYNSAVFIGPFDIGQVDLGVDLTQNDGNALCNGQSYILDTHLDPTEYSFEWFKDDVEIEGETGATLTVTEDGEYTVTAQYLLSTCAGTDSIVIEFYPAVEEVTGNPADLAECDSSGYDVFDLSDNTTTILEGLTPADYTVTYYASEAEAQDGTADGLDLSYTNTVQFEQPIWVRIFNNVTGCFGVKTFNLIVSTTPPVVTITPDFSICFSGGSGEITVTSTDFDPADATYTWTHDGNDIADTTSTITVTEGGVYEVTANHLGCTATASTTVGVIPAPVPEVPADVDACNSYILPVFATTGQTYLNVNGDPLSPGDVLTDTQVVTVRAESNTTPPCYAEDTFQVTIVPGPVLAPVTDVAACDSYTLPALAEGNYFTATGGGGTPLSAGAVIETTQTIYVYVETLTCTSEVFFKVTISTAPVIDAPVDVAACGTYELPPLAGGNYYTEELGGGTMLNAGDAVTLTQTIYVYEAAADNADCYSQNSFEVVIVPAPVVDVTQGCEDGAYVLGADTANGTYVWTDPSGVEIGTEATVIVKVAGLYHVTVTPVAETDCPFVVDVPVESTACSIPRGISPDNDGKNDEFDLTALDVMKLRIYNRYGTEVYSYSNYTNQWHGQQDSGSELPTGTYFYMVERRNGISLTGWVYINRRD
jgi:gliding motility-associated-like protein